MSSRRYFTWAIIVCVGLASIVGSSHLYWRHIATPSLGYPDIIRCQVSPSALPYGIADFEKLHALRAWFRGTQLCNVSESVLDCQLEIVNDGNKTQLKISSFAPSSSSDRKWVYVQWHGHVRRGSLSDLQTILCEPESASRIPSQPAVCTTRFSTMTPTTMANSIGKRLRSITMQCLCGETPTSTAISMKSLVSTKTPDGKATH